MKKVILASIVVIAGLSASCQKSYSCYCTNGTTSTVKASSLSGAETSCTSKNTSTYSCAIQ